MGVSTFLCKPLKNGAFPTPPAQNVSMAQDEYESYLALVDKTPTGCLQNT